MREGSHVLRIFMAFAFVALIATPIAAQSDEEVAAARLVYIDGDYATALQVLRPAAEAGNPVAQNLLGDAYDDGNGVERDAAKAVEWFEKAAAQDFDKALHNLGLLYADGREGIPSDYARAIEYYDRAVALDYPHSINNRANLHEHGLGGEVDLRTAAELYERAVDLGNPVAMNNLGRFYQKGEAVDEDYGYALYLFWQSASLGEVSALSNLGAMYSNGYGVGQDSLAAMALYKMAAEAGNAQAAVNLAYELIEGEEGWLDPARGWAWCLAALERSKPGDDYSADCDYLATVLDAGAMAAGAAMVGELPGKAGG
ncbi:MAG: sel1 repeat family protein [Rhodobacter sp.]|nr:sel1 repeat family protein [Rhodobacter sp.]